MTTNPTVSTMISDDQLWQMSRAGDREAFGQIVERYQSLICSLAYSACGNLARSEDLAQETFVTAWRKLPELREPAKLRAWLCGIVRNLSANAARRELRRGGPAESLELVAEHASVEADPAAQAVSQEEAQLLWRSLGGLPESYREPMVLFYRQGRSAREVAEALELTEETVRQRLSRGRAMLRDELAEVVESTLTRSRPGAAFTVAVLVALPMVTATTASAAVGAGVAAGGGLGATGKGMLAKAGLGMFVGPLIGLYCATLGMRAAASQARSTEERALTLRYARWIIAYCLVMSLGLAAVLSQAGKLYTASAGPLILGVSGWTVALVGGILLACQRLDREVRRIRVATHTTDEEFAPVVEARGGTMKLPKHFESETQLLGLPVFAAAWGGSSSDAKKSRAVCAWIAVGDVAVSPFLAFGGVAVAPIALGAVTVGILSLSLFWGVALGVLSVGSLAFGWWALGCAAVGVKGAVGFAAMARDHAVGFVASASQTGAAARQWVRWEWPADFMETMSGQAVWWIPACVGFGLLLRAWNQKWRHG